MLELTIETFQNEVLRPIIKNKNDFYIAYFDNYLGTQNIRFENPEDARNKIENCLKTENSIKNIFIGSIVSNFDSSQIGYFFKNKQEISKRIVNIISKRIFDNKFS
jgi:hypothetical protein